MSSKLAVRATVPVSSFEQDAKSNPNLVREGLNASALQAANPARLEGGSGAGPEDSRKAPSAVGSSSDANWREGSRFDVMA